MVGMVVHVATISATPDRSVGRLAVRSGVSRVVHLLNNICCWLHQGTALVVEGGGRWLAVDDGDSSLARVVRMMVVRIGDGGRVLMVVVMVLQSCRR